MPPFTRDKVICICLPLPALSRDSPRKYSAKPPGAACPRAAVRIALAAPRARKREQGEGPARLRVHVGSGFVSQWELSSFWEFSRAG